MEDVLLEITSLSEDKEIKKLILGGFAFRKHYVKEHQERIPPSKKHSDVKL